MMWPAAKPGPRPGEDSYLLRRLSSLAQLSPAELQLLRDMAVNPRRLPNQAELCFAGRVQTPQVLMSGWACYQRVLRDGRRQILSFLLPGDFIGSVMHSTLPASRTALALTPVVTADAVALQTAMDAVALPGLVDAVHRTAYAEEVRMRDHIVRLGRQTAYERVVHLMLEFRHRLNATGQVLDDGFAVPLTQEVMADALGLSVVHINRTLQQIRRDSLFELRSGYVKLRQVEAMETMVDWSPPLG